MNIRNQSGNPLQWGRLLNQEIYSRYSYLRKKLEWIIMSWFVNSHLWIGTLKWLFWYFFKKQILDFLLLSVFCAHYCEVRPKDICNIYVEGEEEVTQNLTMWNPCYQNPVQTTLFLFYVLCFDSLLIIVNIYPRPWSFPNSEQHIVSTEAVTSSKGCNFSST